MRMIEKVARAIARKHHNIDRDGIFPDYKSLDWMVDQTWPLHVGKAKAAIEAMRDPTEKMGVYVRENCGGVSHDYEYKRWIDAALSEEPNANDI